jgi:hypothetical protein
MAINSGPSSRPCRKPNARARTRRKRTSRLEPGIDPVRRLVAWIARHADRARPLSSD